MATAASRPKISKKNDLVYIATVTYYTGIRLGAMTIDSNDSGKTFPIPVHTPSPTSMGIAVRTRLLPMATERLSEDIVLSKSDIIGESVLWW